MHVRFRCKTSVEHEEQPQSYICTLIYIYKQPVSSMLLKENQRTQREHYYTQAESRRKNNNSSDRFYKFRLYFDKGVFVTDERFPVPSLNMNSVNESSIKIDIYLTI